MLGAFAGTLFSLAVVVNTLFWGVLVFAVTPLKLAVPWRPWRRWCGWVLGHVAECWVSVVNGLTRLLPTEWDFRGDLDGLCRDEWYLMICNHRSWFDIPVLTRMFHRRVPFVKFFIKKQLLWIPIFGQALWALDMPVMHRYSRQFLERHPHLRGRDLETTRRACEKYEHQPVTVINFLEGTRFTPAKHRDQQSPYRHLLRPRAGGVGYVLGAMGDRFSAVLDVTIVYPDVRIRLWDAMCGRLPRVIAHVRRRTLASALVGGDYGEDDAYRRRVQDWVTRIWEDKDRLVEDLLAGGPGSEEIDRREARRAGAG